MERVLLQLSDPFEFNYFKLRAVVILLLCDVILLLIISLVT